jgi:hypothetical protein
MCNVFQACTPRSRSPWPWRGASNRQANRRLVPRGRTDNFSESLNTALLKTSCRCAKFLGDPACAALFSGGLTCSTALVAQCTAYAQGRAGQWTAAATAVQAAAVQRAHCDVLLHLGHALRAARQGQRMRMCRLLTAQPARASAAESQPGCAALWPCARPRPAVSRPAHGDTDFAMLPCIRQQIKWSMTGLRHNVQPYC